MSRNRGSTECDCGLWRFQTETPRSVDDGSLLTADQYLAAIGWTECPYLGRHTKRGSEADGYGYESRLVGERHYWYSADGRGGASYPHPDYPERRLVARYVDVPPEARYRYRRLECPFCRRQYVGWYARHPHNELTEAPAYELYDTSFWHSFNDEPADEDVANVREWTPEKLAALARRWNEEES